MPRSSVLIVGIFVWSAQAQAPVDALLDRVVNSVRFEPAQQPLPEVELRALLPLKPGERLTRIAVRQAITDRKSVV